MGSTSNTSPKNDFKQSEGGKLTLAEELRAEAEQIYQEALEEARLTREPDLDSV